MIPSTIDPDPLKTEAYMKRSTKISLDAIIIPRQVLPDILLLITVDSGYDFKNKLIVKNKSLLRQKLHIVK